MQLSGNPGGNQVIADSCEGGHSFLIQLAFRCSNDLLCQLGETRQW